VRWVSFRVLDWEVLAKVRKEWDGKRGCMFASGTLLAQLSFLFFFLPFLRPG